MRYREPARADRIDGQVAAVDRAVHRRVEFAAAGQPLYAAAMDGLSDDDERRAAIVRLEARIEELAARLESCRKFILAARAALVVGAVLLIALVFGLIAFDPRLFVGAIAALLGGIVAWGSNASTAQEAASALTAAERDRAALIAQIELRIVGGRDLPAG